MTNQLNPMEVRRLLTAINAPERPTAPEAPTFGKRKRPVPEIIQEVAGSRENFVQWEDGTWQRVS